ncbi:diacylglycerol O-acyltransferase 2-like [Ambystoma mexicanum]|uniref:diacylglycerol O-acyltransferase 2-like n=1 Tax=Ambystoma mexicanum TaxID=8296 RepID=UPI0037E77E07
MKCHGMMNESMKKHLQSLAVSHGVVFFFGMGIVFAVVFFYLLFTSLWLIPVLYYLWVLIDRDTPERGGRRSDWLRRWTLWRYFKDYFPIKMIKTAELSPDRNYIFGCHPHGIICAGAFSSFGTNANDFSQVFPGIRPHLAILAGLFRFPLIREYMMYSGMVAVSKASLNYLLSKNGKGNAVVIVIGGAAESLNCLPGEERVILRSRKGFVRLALEHGADLVPVYSFGENNTFEQVVFEEGSWGRSLQLKIQKHVGFAPCLLKGRGVFFPNSWGLNPFARPITTVLGKPIRVPHIGKPTSQEVDLYHGLYMDGLKELFDEHKVQCGLAPNQQLHIL